MEEIAARAVRLESRTNLLFSFEKMALRDAVKPVAGAGLFAEGLFDYVYGRGDTEGRFTRWIDVVGSLPRRQTRVLTWPVATVFGFIGDPGCRVPQATGHEDRRPPTVLISSTLAPELEHLRSLRDFARRSAGLEVLRPHMIDIQSFIWVQGSD